MKLIKKINVSLALTNTKLYLQLKFHYNIKNLNRKKIFFLKEQTKERNKNCVIKDKNFYNNINQ